VRNEKSNRKYAVEFASRSVAFRRFGVKTIEKMDVENVMKQGEIKKAQKRSLKK